MCGIIAVLGRRSDRDVPDPVDLLARAERAAARLDDPAALGEVAAELEAIDAALLGTPGVLALLADGATTEAIERCALDAERRLKELEARLDAGALAVDDLEATGAQVIRVKDALWAITRDRLRTAREVGALAGAGAGPATVDAYLAIQIALSAIDRLEVRGRDSAGIHLLVAHPATRPDDAALAARLDPLFTNGSVRAHGDTLGFVYKAAAEIGELGDNTAAIRRTIAEDELLRRALDGPDVQVALVGHTRWASVGIISEPNAHPLNSEEAAGPAGPGARPYVVAALNGDVDNHVELRTAAGLRLPPEITTDAKIIPTLTARRAAEGRDLVDAFRETVRTFEGSVAIAAAAAEDPDRLLLALRGSGQALYVGLTEAAFVVASEPYGLVEVTPDYVRMDGEAGEVVVLDRRAAGRLEGISRMSYAGAGRPVTATDVQRAQITTRDIDRGGAPHFLLKEIGEAPTSVRKTLRGKLVEDRGLLAVELPAGAVPPDLVDGLASGRISNVITTGQGTAAVAAQSVAVFFEEAGIPARAAPAAELSGFQLRDDMSDTLVVAVSQSGTSADTNRTVDLVRARGATVIAIVNRRNSDLVDKSDGVLYTSDGRDVEMAVPSTKAFYAQIAAGVLLASGLARAAGKGDRHRMAEVLEALRRLPDAMAEVLARRDRIAEAARRHGPPRRYWAMVGNGPNRVAAAELRIKLSELCYKSIACDVTEDKKHIDLSSEPLIFVCAAGLDGSTAGDVAKEIAIFRAHKALPIVVASDGEERYEAAAEVIFVPRVHPDLDFVLAAMAGHLFGYEAAVAIDNQARQLREIRGQVEDCIDAPDVLETLASRVDALARRFFSELRAGDFNGHLEASTAVRLASLLRYATGSVPLEAYELEYGRVGSPGAVVEDLLGALNDAIDELTRPIDAIKHQAKTVTVGISRAEDTYADVAVVRELLATGVDRDRLGYRSLRTVAALDPAVVRVTGYSRYAVDGDVASGAATIHRVDSGGIAAGLPSRTDTDPALKGTKRRAAFEREVTVSRGLRDGRTIVIVPEVKDNQVTGITLLHVDFRDRLDAETARRVLTGYRNRYNAIVDAVTETEPSFDDEVLGRTDLVELLVQPVHVLAANWRS